jgi:4-amino-4-deoxychorismate lyase
LAGLKHLNRLELVLARAQLQGSGCFEGILCSSSGYLACGTMSNLFIVKDDYLLTPRVDRCGIAGVMRAVVMREARALGIAIHECDLPPETLLQAQHAFLTNVRLGVRPITRMGSRVLEAGQLSLQLHERVAGLED